MEEFNYHHLRYFWVVAREGSIARASRLLKLAQPTISAQVHELEASLGQKLFARAGRGLALTETGQKVYGFAGQIFRLGNEMVDAVHGQPEAKTIRLRAGVDRKMSRLIAGKLLQPALRVAGRVSLVVRDDTLERLAAQIACGEIDLVLSDSSLLPARIKLHSHMLGECPVSLFAHRSSAARLKRRFPRSLDGAPLLLPGSSPSDAVRPCTRS